MEDRQLEVANGILKAFEPDFEKGKSWGGANLPGTGIRGGKIIGYTSTGKAIYAKHDHEEHANFTSQEHRDAHDIWHKELKERMEKRDNPKRADQAHQGMSYHRITAEKKDKKD